MTMAPGPIPALIVAVPRDKLTMFSVLFRFPTSISTGFMFIPLMEIAALAIVVPMDLMVSVVVVALRVESGSPKNRRARHDGHQNKRTEIPVYSHVVFSFLITVISAAQKDFKLLVSGLQSGDERAHLQLYVPGLDDV
jgi:hypothetical protein